jgi:hypothetical protein
MECKSLVDRFLFRNVYPLVFDEHCSWWKELEVLRNDAALDTISSMPCKKESSHFKFRNFWGKFTIVTLDFTSVINIFRSAIWMTGLSASLVAVRYFHGVHLQQRACPVYRERQTSGLPSQKWTLSHFETLWRSRQTFPEVFRFSESRPFLCHETLSLKAPVSIVSVSWKSF